MDETAAHGINIEFSSYLSQTLCIQYNDRNELTDLSEPPKSSLYQENILDTDTILESTSIETSSPSINDWDAVRSCEIQNMYTNILASFWGEIPREYKMRPMYWSTKHASMYREFTSIKHE